MVNINFKNIGKIFRKDRIQKMRTEDLRLFYKNKSSYMTPIEKKRFEKKFFDRDSGHEFFVERKGGTLKFHKFDED